MPAVVPFIPLIAAGVGAGATVAGARSAGKSSRRAAETQRQTDTEALALERERDAEARRQWEADQAFQRAQFEAQEEERIYNRRLLEEREARRAPYRAASGAALGRLGDLLGLSFDRSPGQMPSGGGMPAAPPAPAASMSRPMGPGLPPDARTFGPAIPATRPSYRPATGLTLGDMAGMRPRRRMA